MDELTEIGILHNTDKAFFHGFTTFYHEYFKEIRYEKLIILEIGILYGKSLQTLRDYFPNAEIHAIDINPALVKDFGSRIHTYVCDQTDGNKLNTLFEHMIFDIIIDDGSHMTMHQLQSLGFLFKKLKKNGLYICEDIHTSLRTNFINSQTIPLKIFENYKTNKTINVCEISIEDNNYINNNLKDIVVFKREKNAYKCYGCGQINNLNSSTCNNCKINLSPSDLSCTSILFKK